MSEDKADLSLLGMAEELKQTRERLRVAEELADINAAREETDRANRAEKELASADDELCRLRERAEQAGGLLRACAEVCRGMPVSDDMREEAMSILAPLVQRAGQAERKAEAWRLNAAADREVKVQAEASIAVLAEAAATAIQEYCHESQYPDALDMINKATPDRARALLDVAAALKDATPVRATDGAVRYYKIRPSQRDEALERWEGSGENG